MLDAYLKFGTLAERTDKQPGMPGTQQDKWRVASKAALSFATFGHERNMKPDQSIDEYFAHSKIAPGTLPAVTPSSGIGKMIAFYRDVRADDCPVEQDGDMLLFQWGTYDWGEGPSFQINITRQFTLNDRDADQAMSQLSLTFHFEPTVSNKVYEKGSRWCPEPSQLIAFIDFIHGQKPFKDLSGQNAARVEIDWSPI